MSCRRQCILVWTLMGGSFSDLSWNGEHDWDCVSLIRFAFTFDWKWC
jgi:hypothetical protein